MTNLSLEELERRVAKDPASIAFAQLAENYLRAGRCDDAVRVARDGLTRHPGYLSARVTLGRALVELGDLDPATTELETVLQSAPDNLAAIRALAEIHQRRGDAPEPPAAAEEPDRSLDLDVQNFNTALEALDALTLDLPPGEPDVALRDEFDLGSFLVDDAPSEPAGHGDWNLDALDLPAEDMSHTPADPALEALEHWLGALESDRTERQRR